MISFHLILTKFLQSLTTHCLIQSVYELNDFQLMAFFNCHAAHGQSHFVSEVGQCFTPPSPYLTVVSAVSFWAMSRFSSVIEWYHPFRASTSIKQYLKCRIKVFVIDGFLSFFFADFICRCWHFIDKL
jgi:hypothetical protein